MENDEKIINKQISVSDIIELAKYFEERKEYYQKLIEEDLKKNKEISYKEQIYSYKEVITPKVSYEITFKDNKSIKQSDYEWFILNLSDVTIIKRIIINFRVTYSDNTINKEKPMNKSINTYIAFHEDRVTLKVDGVGIEEEVYNEHSKIKEILEKGENRYNKTIKNKNVRIQSFCLSIGFILSYILYIVLCIVKNDLPETLTFMLNSKYVLVFGQWFVSAILGNIVGHPIMMRYYKNLLPGRKYSHYSTSSKKAVYVEDIENYTNGCEIQIGKNTNNSKNREKIEKIFKITNKIILIQMVISIILFCILK